MALREVFEGRYEALDRVGPGGMGTVYRARDRVLDEPRLIKIVRLPPAPELAERFLREARAASLLRHPNLAILHDFALTGEGLGYLVFEDIEGMTLQEALRRFGPPPIALALEVGRQTCRALGALHQQHIVLRDLSPASLMLTRDFDGWPLVKLLDCGLAKSPAEEAGEGSATGEALLGKLRYASPEQLGGDLIDERSDLYALGVMLYEMLTGQPPVSGQDAPSWTLDFAVSDPERRVPHDLRALVLCALARDPGERIASADDLCRGLEAIHPRFPLTGDELDPLFAAPPEPPELPELPEETAPPIPIPVSLDAPPAPPSLDEIAWRPRAPAATAVARLRRRRDMRSFLPAALPVAVILVLALFVFLKGRAWWNPQVAEAPPVPLVAPPPPALPPSPTPLTPPTSPAADAAPPAALPKVEEVEEGLEEETGEVEAQALPAPREPAVRPAPEVRASPPVRIAARRPEVRRVPAPPPVPAARGPMRRGDLIAQGPGVAVPVPLEMPAFSYPAAARGQGGDVAVRLDLLVDENGKVIDAMVREGAPSALGFNEVALAAARKVPFQPATRNDIPGKMWTEMIFEFADPAAPGRSGR